MSWRTVEVQHHRLYKPYDVKHCAAAQDPTPFGRAKRVQNGKDHAKSRKIRISEISPKFTDLETAETFLYEFVETCGLQNLNQQYFNSVLTIPQPKRVGFTILKTQKPDPKL